MTEFSKQSLRRLKKAGWSADRTVDISHYVEFLERCGYTVFETAKVFLKNFGGLFITTKDYRKDPMKITAIDITFDDIRSYRDNPDLQEAIDALGRDLCYVGEFFIDESNPLPMILLIDDQGIFYLYWDSFHLDRIGYSKEEMINNFVDGFADSQRIITLGEPWM